jgi:hypothetical protein
MAGNFRQPAFMDSSLVYYDGQGQEVAIDVYILVEVYMLVGEHVTEKAEGAMYIFI